MAGFDLGNVHGILNGSERVQPLTLKRFIERFAPFNLAPARTAVLRNGGDDGVHRDPPPGEPPKIVTSTPRNCRMAKRCVRRRKRNAAGQLRRPGRS